MMQHRRTAVLEAVTNTACGFVLSNLAWPLIQIFVLHQPYRWGQGLAVVFWFTILSVARNYAVRRLFTPRSWP